MSDYTPAADLLGHTARLDQQLHFPLLGVPLEIRSNSPAVIAAAERSFGRWRGLEPELIEPDAPLEISIVVHPSEHVDAARAVQPTTTFVQRMHSYSFIAAGGANLLTAQVDAGRALAFVTPELVADDLQLRYHVIECLSLLLASYRDRTPIHAGALVGGERALLLVGRSTAGKSTLCYAGLRAGFQLLAEDVVYVGLRNGLRLWGNPWRIHLLPDAPRLFAELAKVQPQIQANGKYKLAVEVESFGADRLRRHVTRGVICLLQRHARRETRIERIDPQTAHAALRANLEAGFDLHRHTQPAVVQALVQDGAYRLTLGSDLDDTIGVLRSLVG